MICVDKLRREPRNWVLPCPGTNSVIAFSAVEPTDNQKQYPAEMAVLEQGRAKTRALKQGIMNVLLTGKTRILNRLNKEVEDACT